jgi:arginine utilization regulatory protein
MNELREDLYYRLISSEIELPALSERPDDVRVLINYFIQLYNSRMNVQIIKIEPEVLERLEEYPWPGNVRELRNVIESFYHNVNETGIIRLENLSDKILRGGKGRNAGINLEKAKSFREIIEEFEKNLIETELSKAEGNAAKAARNLKMSKQCFKYKTDKYQIR